MTTEEFIAKAKEVHGNSYDYSRVEYVNMHTKVKIICPVHGLFEQEPSNHILHGNGCSKCNKEDGRRKPMNDVIRDARKAHGDTYDYSRVVYVNSKTPVEIVCPVHGVFMQKMEKHIAGEGCPMCAKNHKDDKDSFIRKAREKHGNRFDYSKVNYVDSFTKVCIIDPVHGEFWQTPNSHLNGRESWIGRAVRINETKKERHTFHTSSSEVRVKELLEKKFGKENVECQYYSEVYPFWCDFYIYPLKLYIEINVYFSHGGHFFDKTSEADCRKRDAWKEKAKTSKLYDKSLYVWTQVDPVKRKTALENHLNYLAFWKYDLSDFMEWYDHFDETQQLCNI